MAALAAEPDLVTALLKFTEAGEALGVRCREAGSDYLATWIKFTMKRLHEEALHESVKRREGAEPWRKARS
jgi:hypothetical protein